MMHPAQPMVPPQQYTVRPPAVPQVGVTTVGILYPQKVILYVFVDIFAPVSRCICIVHSAHNWQASEIC